MSKIKYLDALGSALVLISWILLTWSVNTWDSKLKSTGESLNNLMEISNFRKIEFRLVKEIAITKAIILKGAVKKQNIIDTWESKEVQLSLLQTIGDRSRVSRNLLEIARRARVDSGLKIDKEIDELELERDRIYQWIHGYLPEMDSLDLTTWVPKYAPSSGLEKMPKGREDIILIAKESDNCERLYMSSCKVVISAMNDMYEKKNRNQKIYIFVFILGSIMIVAHKIILLLKASSN